MSITLVYALDLTHCAAWADYSSVKKNYFTVGESLDKFGAVAMLIV